MAQRGKRQKRKKRQATHAGTAERSGPAKVTEPEPDPSPTRSREPAPQRERPAMYSRSEAKNQAVRDALVPLEEGERPLAVTIGAIAAVTLVVVQLPLYVVWDGDERPALPGFIFFTGLMLVMAWGMWKVKYWAVLGFQALLAIIVLLFSLLLLRAETATAALIAVAVIGVAGTLFYFMVKALARIQMPEYRG